jgi:hypothetical protein
VENARTLFPKFRFDVGNVFQIKAEDGAYDFCYVHDLFEHLSVEGLERAARELARVTRHAMCLHFFNMDEMREHVVRPVEDYHWNTLSMPLVRDLFASLGFDSQVIHIETFLMKEARAESTHNSNAYTFVLWRRVKAPGAS